MSRGAVAFIPVTRRGHMPNEGRYSIASRKISAVRCICTPRRSYIDGAWWRELLLGPVARIDVDDRRLGIDRANNAHVIRSDTAAAAAHSLDDRPTAAAASRCIIIIVISAAVRVLGIIALSVVI